MLDFLTDFRVQMHSSDWPQSVYLGPFRSIQGTAEMRWGNVGETDNARTNSPRLFLA